MPRDWSNLAAQSASLSLELAKSRSVLICTPIARDPVWQYTVSLLKTIRTLDALGIKCDATFVIGNSNLPKARNELLAEFRASEYTDTLLIDDDMGWSADAVVRLLASPHPIIAGVGRKRCKAPNSDPEVWAVRWFPGEIEQDENGAISVPGVGAAFMKVSREALEQMIAAYPELKRNAPKRLTGLAAQSYYRMFEFHDDGTEESGEDMAFCDRWRALGGKVWIDPEIELTHVGSHGFTGKVSEILTEKEATAA